jgi:hypothetical protein
VEDRRIPAPDVLGYLADRSIRRSQLLLVADHVRKVWPNVTSVRCGAHDDRPYFLIHIAPFSKSAQRDHWTLADWIETTLQTEDCQFFFLPPVRSEPFSSAITIYERDET